MKQKRPKRLKDRVIVITGASSGIGLATARMAARRGARVVLAARNHDTSGTWSTRSSTTADHDRHLRIHVLPTS